jgi:hypothetical protein
MSIVLLLVLAPPLLLLELLEPHAASATAAAPASSDPITALLLNLIVLRFSELGTGSVSAQANAADGQINP